MPSRLVATGVWETLTAAAKRSKKPAQVAVAYLGKGATELLPLPPGSSLVVDASEAAVRGGQTYPAELLKLHRRGASIYRLQNLHAKVFAFDNSAFVGSTNASIHSAEVLQEAIAQITDPGTVRAVRKFIKNLCVELLGPLELKRLQKIYRPPSFKPRGGRAQGNHTRDVTALRVAHVREMEISDELSKEFDAGRRDAAKKRKRGRHFYVEEFFWPSPSAFRDGQLVIQVWKNSRGRAVSPPGHVIHTRRSGSKTLVYVELPDDNWKSLSRIPASARKALSRNGSKGSSTARSLLMLWNKQR